MGQPHDRVLRRRDRGRPQRARRRGPPAARHHAGPRHQRLTLAWIASTDELGARPRRVLVAGTSGSGKSTLARAIARTLELEYVEIDALFHGSGWTPNADFVDAVRTRIVASAWATEWQYDQVRELLADRAELLVWLDLPRAAVMRTLVRRTVRRSLRGTELWNGNVEPPLHTFLTDPDHIVRWAWRAHALFPGRVTACAARRPELSVVALRSWDEARAWLAGPLARSRTALPRT